MERSDSGEEAAGARGTMVSDKIMQQAEHKDIPIVLQAQVVKSGVVRVMELQETGWTYVKP